METKSINYYRKAADQGQVNAQNNLGVCYDNGEGVNKDYKEAVFWYRKAANQGYAKAQNSLVECYKNNYTRLENEYNHLREQMKLKDELLEILRNNSQINLSPPYEPSSEYKNMGDGGNGGNGGNA